MAAADVYIRRCNGVPVHKYISDSSLKQALRPLLLKFIKGTLKQKTNLAAEHPSQFELFKKVWSIREQPMVSAQYGFFLLPSYKSDCPHPVCSREKPESEPTWFKNGPPMSSSYDTRHWGCGDCTSCSSEICTGHY